MNSQVALLVQPYVALFLRYCSVLPDCCSGKYSFEEKPLLREFIADDECIPKCMWKPESVLPSSKNELFNKMTQIVYCSAECVSTKFGLVDEKGSIITSNVLDRVVGAVQLSQPNTQLCFNRNYEDTQHNSTTYHDKAMQAIFCLWEQTQMQCKADDPKVQEKCDAFRSIPISGQKIAAEDVFGCMVQELTPFL